MIVLQYLFIDNIQDLFSPTQDSNRISDKEELQIATANNFLGLFLILIFYPDITRFSFKVLISEVF